MTRFSLGRSLSSIDPQFGELRGGSRTPGPAAVPARNTVVQTRVPCEYDGMMTPAVDLWWSLLCSVAVVNAVAWAGSAIYLSRRRHVLTASAYAAHCMQLRLSAVYVFGCAFRSAFPVFDIPRLCVVDSWLSSVLIGRSVATCAELCFAAQWALMLREAASATGSRLGQVAARLILPLIALAELCSWYSVLTTLNIGHVIEESLWGATAGLLVLGLLAVGPRCAVPRRSVLAVGCVSALAYALYMACVDVPMYWHRWLADRASGRPYFSLLQGAHDAAVRWLVAYRWEQWRSEVVWMTLYFSVAVWLSIALIHAPRFRALRPAREQVRLNSLLQSARP